MEEPAGGWGATDTSGDWVPDYWETGSGATFASSGPNLPLIAAVAVGAYVLYRVVV